MRSLNRNQRGSVNWPFVIVLLGMLVFIYMWWQAQDQKDDRIGQIEKLEQSNADLAKLATERGEIMKSMTDVVGFGVSAPGGNGIPATSRIEVAKLIEHLKPDGVSAALGEGEDAAAVVPTLKHLIDQAYVIYDRKRRTGEHKGEPKDYKYETMTDELKAKVRELSETEVPAKPIPPVDPNDSAAKAKFDSDMEAYDQAHADWRKLFDEAANMKGFSEFMDNITQYGLPDADTVDPVRVNFMSTPTDTTVQAFLDAVRGLPEKMRKEFEENKKADIAEIVRLAAEVAKLQAELTDVQGKLDAANKQFVNDLTAKDGQIETLQQQVSDAKLAQQTAENALTAAKDQNRKDVAKLDAELTARKEALRLIKAKRDLIIRRDDKDGEIVAANNNLRTASINLGFADKVYVGQRFRVSANDKAGDRIAKGEVMVTKVTGNKSARVRITQAVANLTGGDFIHNPFYTPGEKISVFFAGPITKWPASMAKQRLARINVMLQDAVNGDTDYIVIPNSWVVAEQAKADAGDDEDADEEEGSVGAKSPIEMMQAHARRVGAEVISESLFDAFLNY